MFGLIFCVVEVMFLKSFFNSNQNQIAITREQGSSFAKQMANDFNPLHDVEAKKFVVPGDLLFAIVLNNGGLYQNMSFTFNGMVTEKSLIRLQTTQTNHLDVVDQNDKACMSVEFNGPHSSNEQLIEKLTKAYVNFSGKAFPHILVPLMKEKNVMINPARPMVMYQSMNIHLDNLDIEDVELKMADSKIDVEGKRGKIFLHFEFISAGKVVGTGEKQMLLSGLREYNQVDIDQLVADYSARKESILI